jgi:hypothetical protein
MDIESLVKFPQLSRRKRVEGRYKRKRFGRRYPPSVCRLAVEIVISFTVTFD